MKQVSLEVFEPSDAIVRVGSEDIAVLKDHLSAAPRKRVRLCAHRGVEDALHEMFIVLAHGSYIRPHQHIGKAESMYVIEGSADAVFFDDAGAIVDVIPLGEYASGRRFFYRIGDPTFHTVLPRSKVFAFLETVRGPFRREDNVPAPWSPDESDAAAVSAYLSRLTAAVDAFVAARDGGQSSRAVR